MSTPGPDAGPHWLDDEEMAAWLPLLRLVQLLPQALDKQLRAEAGISHAYYSVLAVLSAAEDRTLGMGELARLTLSSPSRLTHAVSVMEERGWLTRRQCTDDKRAQFATLTDAGVAVLERIAPGHVAEVRRTVFDRLDRDQVRQLRQIALAMLGELDGKGGIDLLQRLEGVDG